MKKIILLTGLLGGICVPALAQGFKIDLLGVKQNAMGHTGAGYVFDASTIYFNPGGLSFTPVSSLSLGVSALMPKTEFVETGHGNAYYSQNQIFTPFGGYVSFKINPRFSAGIGSYTPYGSGLTWPDNFSGRFILHSIQLQTIYIQPTLAYKITDKIGIGAGAIYSLGSVTLSKDIPISNQQGNYARATLTGNGNGWGYSAGIYVKPDDRFSAGLTYHSALKLNFNNGNANFTGVPQSFKTELANTTFSSTIPLPADLTLGFGLRIDSSWLITLDADLVFWNTYDTLTFDYKNQTSLLTNTKEVKAYQSVPGIRAGVQYSPDKKVDIRAGAFYEFTPVQNGYLAPDFPDNNRFGLTAGLGIHASSKLEVDLSFLWLDVLQRTGTDRADGFSGTYKSFIYAPGGGITYSF